MSDWDCFDCKTDTSEEYYMVTDSLWEKFGVGDHMLCIGCLEHRIGRELWRRDFTNCPLNIVNMGWSKSERLRDRLQRKYPDASKIQAMGH